MPVASSVNRLVTRMLEPSSGSLAVETRCQTRWLGSRETTEARTDAAPVPESGEGFPGSGTAWAKRSVEAPQQHMVRHKGFFIEYLRGLMSDCAGESQGE